MNAITLSAPARSWFLHEVDCDTMEPTYIRGRDSVLCVPVFGYAGEGIYLIDCFGLYRCERRGDRIHMWRDNRMYVTQEASLAEFNAANLAIVAADVRIRNREIMGAGA